MAQQKLDNTSFDSAIRDLSTTTISANVDNEYIIVTADKMKLRLRDFSDALKASYGWKAPLSLLSTSFIALVTGEFKNLWFIQASMVRLSFLVAFICSLLWLFNSLLNLRKHRHKTTVDYCINELKNTTSPIVTEPVESEKQRPVIGGF